jgi:hypothetical protein
MFNGCTPDILPVLLQYCDHGSIMARGNKGRPKKESPPRVYHDCDTDTYGACSTGEPQGSFKAGVFTEHRCICMPAHLTSEELAVKEKKFREENPDW